MNNWQKVSVLSICCQIPEHTSTRNGLFLTYRIIFFGLFADEVMKLNMFSVVFSHFALFNKILQFVLKQSLNPLISVTVFKRTNSELCKALKCYLDSELAESS